MSQYYVLFAHQDFKRKQKDFYFIFFLFFCRGSDNTCWTDTVKPTGLENWKLPGVTKISHWSPTCSWSYTYSLPCKWFQRIQNKDWYSFISDRLGKCLIFLSKKFKWKDGSDEDFNHFTAKACTISGLKDAWTCRQTVYIPGLWHIYFQCCAFWWKSFTWQCEKEDERA